MTHTAGAQSDFASHRTIWSIAAPAILANSAGPLVGLVDTAVIGHLPSPVHLAAVGIGATFFSFLFWAFGFLRMGTTGLVAQASGAGDQKRMLREIVRGLILGLGVGTVTIIGMGPVVAGGMTLLAPPADVAPLAESYIRIRIWAAPATLMGYAVTGALIGLGRTDKVLVLQLVLNGLNLTLNLIFVLGLDLGVAGLALGSVIAETVTALLGTALLVRMFSLRALLSAMREPATWAASKLKRLLLVNGFIFVRTLMLLLVFTYLTRKAALMGTVELASAQVLLTFSLLISLGLDGVAFAAETLAGQAFGAQSRQQFDRATRRTFVWAGGVALLYTAVFALLGQQIVAALTSLSTVREMVSDLMPMVAVLPIVALASYQYDGLYIGATAAKAMAGTMALSFAVYFSLVDRVTAQYGLAGLWGCLLLFLAVRGLTQALWYRRVAPLKPRQGD